MTIDEFRRAFMTGDIRPPFTVHTIGGRSYPVEDMTNIWLPPGLPGFVVISMPRMALAVLRAETVDSVTFEEHENPRRS